MPPPTGFQPLLSNSSCNFSVKVPISKCAFARVYTTVYRRDEPTGIQGPYARRKPQVNLGRKKEGAQILEYNNEFNSAQVIPASLDETRVIWT